MKGMAIVKIDDGTAVATVCIESKMVECVGIENLTVGNQKLDCWAKPNYECCDLHPHTNTM